MATRTLLSLCLCPLLLIGCDDAAPDRGPAEISFGAFKGDDPRSPDRVLDTALGNADEAGALLEVVITDVWGRLPDRPALVTLRRAGGPTVSVKGFLEPVALRLAEPGDYELVVQIPDHDAERMWFTVGADGRIPVPDDQVTHWSFSVDAGPKGDVHALYIGVEHRYFAASGPAPRRGNALTLFDNGRDTFSRLAADLATVEERAHFSYWLMRADFELERDPDYANTSAAERQANTIGAWLEALPGTRRVLLAEFWGDSDLVNELGVLDDTLVDFAETGGDGVELLTQPNETEVPYYDSIPLRDDEWSYRERLLAVNPAWAERDFRNEELVRPSKYDREVKWTDLQIGSWHQKFAVLDQRVAYVGGMNMNYADWDDADLRVFHPLRAPIDATTGERADIEAGKAESATRPRRDYTLRITGRLVDDVEALFQRRWDLAQVQDDGDWAQHASSFTRDVPPDPRGRVAGVEAQLNVTTPMPFWEHSILEGMRRAIESAEQYIFIEDQYFRAPLLNALITDRMNAVPGLKLIVVTNPIDYRDPGRKWTAITHRHFQETFPDRYLLLCLKAHDQRPWRDGAFVTVANVDLHSKMLIVDDELMSVGSANKNNRGLIYEGEANVLVRDLAFVSAARQRIWQDYVGAEFADELANPDEAFALFKWVAEHNQDVLDSWDDLDHHVPGAVLDGAQPIGRLFPLDVPHRWWFDLGPDGA